MSKDKILIRGDGGKRRAQEEVERRRAQVVRLERELRVLRAKAKRTTDILADIRYFLKNGQFEPPDLDDLFDAWGM